MSAWKRPFVTGIHTSGQNLKNEIKQAGLKHPLFYALLDGVEAECLVDKYLRAEDYVGKEYLQ